MEQEQGLEPVQDAGESQEGVSAGRDWGYDLAAPSGDCRLFAELLFGEPREPPSPYYCAQCNEDILAQDVAWDRGNQPRCSKCRSILRKARTSFGGAKSDNVCILRETEASLADIEQAFAWVDDQKTEPCA